MIGRSGRNEGRGGRGERGDRGEVERGGGLRGDGGKWELTYGVSHKCSPTFTICPED